MASFPKIYRGKPMFEGRCQQFRVLDVPEDKDLVYGVRAGHAAKKWVSRNYPKGESRCVLFRLYDPINETVSLWEVTVSIQTMYSAWDKELPPVDSD